MIGYTPMQVRDIANGRYRPNPQAVFTIYKLTSITGDWLIYGLTRGLSELSAEERMRLLKFEEAETLSPDANTPHPDQKRASEPKD